MIILRAVHMSTELNILRHGRRSIRHSVYHPVRSSETACVIGDLLVVLGMTGGAMIRVESVKK